MTTPADLPMPPGADAAPAQPPRLLVVDDTPANLGLLANLLDKRYRVQLAPSGAKALALARRQPPDLVILDVMMPEMDGYEVCQRLKADPLTRHVPVLFLTALSRPEDETRGFEAGGADFIHKPFNPATVLARVPRTCSSRPGRTRCATATPGCRTSCRRGWPRWTGCARPRCT